MNRDFFSFFKRLQLQSVPAFIHPEECGNAIDDGYLEAWKYSRIIARPLIVLITNMNQAIFFNIVGCHIFNILKGERYRRFQFLR